MRIDTLNCISIAHALESNHHLQLERSEEQMDFFTSVASTCACVRLKQLDAVDLWLVGTATSSMEMQTGNGQQLSCKV